MPKTYLTFLILVLAGLSLSACAQPTSVAKDYGPFAECIAQSGAKFYGAEWCSHCQAQMAAFGDAAGKLPYVECSVPNGQGQSMECNIAGIKAYPTWKFKDGASQTGELEFAELADRTGCAAPQ
jgi:hypothetical protein